VPRVGTLPEPLLGNAVARVSRSARSAAARSVSWRLALGVTASHLGRSGPGSARSACRRRVVPRGEGMEPLQQRHHDVGERCGAVFLRLHWGYELQLGRPQSARRTERLRPSWSVKTRNRTLPDVVVPLLEGLHAFARGDYAAATTLIEPIQDRIVRGGSSHAQREVLPRHAPRRRAPGRPRGTGHGVLLEKRPGSVPTRGTTGRRSGRAAPRS